MSNFSEALKTLRKSRKITQAKLAEDLGVGKSTISMYEVGAREPDFETMEAIADYFNVPMATFVQTPHDNQANADAALKFALFGTADVDDEVFREVKKFAKFAMENHKQK